MIRFHVQTVLCLACIVVFISHVIMASSSAEFTNHGVPGRVAEARGTIATVDTDGSPIVLAVIQDTYNGSPRNSLLIIDAVTGEIEQHFYKENARYAGDSFASMLASSGKFYTMFGDMFLEFDLGSRSWSYSSRIGGLAMSFAEDDKGNVYVATYPTSTLWKLDVVSRTLVNLGRLDFEEMYPYSLAADDSGWIYSGIGTSRSNLVALNLQTGERRDLATEDERRTGQGEVYVGVDGKVYGRPAETAPWYRLENGDHHTATVPATRAVTGAIRWSRTLGDWGNGEVIATFSVPDRSIGIMGPFRRARSVTFDYDTSGAGITSIVAGPDGRIYGSTSHPMRFWSYDPKEDALTDFGGIARIGGGNISRFAVQGDYLIGGAYNGGYLYKYDIKQSWKPESYSQPNPRLLAEIRGPISRPRTVWAYPDGRNVIMAGFAGYGLVGGGIVIYDLDADKYTLLTADELLPGHSTITIRVLPDGNLIGGTSVEAPGGGHPTESIAKLFIMEWPTGKVIFETEPVPGRTVFGRQLGGSRAIAGLEVTPAGLVYGITQDSVFFVFDPTTREVLHQESIQAYGAPPRDSAFVTIQGRVYALLSRALVEFDPDTFEHRRVVDLPVPVTVGGTALLNDTLFFASGSDLWSLQLSN